MTRETKLAAQRWAAILLTAVLIPLVTWAFAKYDASLMKVPRFERDSAVFMIEDAAFKREVRQSLRDIIAGQQNIDNRLTQMNCGDAVRKGCR